MQTAHKIMIASLLFSEGAQVDDVNEFLDRLAKGLEKNEEDAILIFETFMRRVEGDLPDGPAGEVIRVMKAKVHLDDNCRRFGIAVSGMKKVLELLNSNPKSELAAKVILKQVTDVVAREKEQLNQMRD